MRFSDILVFTATAFAVPSPIDLGDGVTLVPRESRHRRGAASGNVHQSLPKFPAIPTVEGTTEVDSNKSNVAYSSNWAGAVLIDSGFTSVTGTFTVPKPSIPSGGSRNTQYAASAWVGIDGDTWSQAILQTGVDFIIEGNSISFDAWYEWFPDYAYNFAGFEINAGDVITTTVTATSTGSGSATVENKSTGKSVSHSFKGESAKLGELNAEWIVEDFSNAFGLVPFADFGTVTFTDATAIKDGSRVGPSGATLIDIRQSGTVLTDSSISSDEVTVAYVG